MESLESHVHAHSKACQVADMCSDVLRLIACCCGQTSHPSTAGFLHALYHNTAATQIVKLSCHFRHLHAACQQHDLDGVQRTPLRTVISVWQA